jgi:hypothetical protein
MYNIILLVYNESKKINLKNKLKKHVQIIKQKTCKRAKNIKLCKKNDYSSFLDTAVDLFPKSSFVVKKTTLVKRG